MVDKEKEVKNSEIPTKENISKARTFHLKRLIFLVCLLVFIYSAYNLISIFLDYRAIDNMNQEIRDRYITTIEYEGSNLLNINWEDLIDRNSDVIGWIYLPGTNINYPVLQGRDNDFYLRRDLDRNHSNAGSIFMEAQNNKLFTDLNTIIYGHNMRNNTKFATINRIANERQELPEFIHIYLPNGILNIYQVVSANRIDTSSRLYQRPLENLEAYYQLMQEGRVKGREFNLEDVNHILTLSTCRGYGANTNRRSVIYAILIEEKDLN